MSHMVRSQASKETSRPKSQLTKRAAGYAYCAIAALSLLDRPLEDSKASHPSKALQAGIRSIPKLAHWLASRQFAYLDAQEEDDQDDPVNFTQPLDLSALSLEENLRHVGYNGRSNKVADTCYCWWVGASLDMLGHKELLERDSSRRFMLEKTAHPIVGGFGKGVGNPPDIYHTFLALSALSVLEEPVLKEFDTSLVVTVETARKIVRARRGMLKLAHEQWEPGNLERDMIYSQLAATKTKPQWVHEMVKVLGI
jgi:geranylgeranyl transferase type-1 subunit beta